MRVAPTVLNSRPVSADSEAAANSNMISGSISKTGRELICPPLTECVLSGNGKSNAILVGNADLSAHTAQSEILRMGGKNSCSLRAVSTVARPLCQEYRT